MFAGPNGSGKSTLKSVISEDLLGVYINPDDIEREIKQFNFLDLREYGVDTTAENILTFFANSTLLEKAELQDESDSLSFSDDKLSFYAVSVNAYFASVCADFIRRELLKKRVSFTFETVMSSPDKIKLLRAAKKFGYRTYLYYIATDDAAINVTRVRQRVASGGHSVPEDKIVSRYDRSLDLLPSAIAETNRAYIFDNSGDESMWMCEITDGVDVDYKQEAVPDWVYRHVVEPLSR